MAINDTNISLALNKASQSLTLELWRNPDHGWGASPGSSSDAWSTAEIVDLLKDIPAAHNIGVPIVAQALSTLVSLQRQDGDALFRARLMFVP